MIMRVHGVCLRCGLRLPEPGAIQYCLLTDSQTMEDEAESFSAGLDKILAFYLMDLEDEES